MNNRRVVVTGYGVISCVGNNVPDFWDALINGRCGIGKITRFDASEYRTQIAGEVKDFDFSGYMNPKDAKRLDLFCQYAIAASDEAMATAGLPKDLRGSEIDPNRVGVQHFDALRRGRPEYGAGHRLLDGHPFDRGIVLGDQA